MHMTLEADYAVRIVHCLSENDKKMDAQKISDETFVSKRFCLKILRKLVANNIVKSFKGAHGGYIIARPASEITLREIIETVDGEYKFSRCLNDDFDCSKNPDKMCPFHCEFDNLSKMVREFLDNITIDGKHKSVDA